MKSPVKATVIAVLLALTFFTPSGALATTTVLSEVEVEDAGKIDSFVPAGLTWPEGAIAAVSKLLEPMKAEAQTVLERLKAAGASSVTITAGKLLNDLPEFTRYEELNALNHESSLVGRGDWAAEVNEEKFGKVATADWNSSLVGFTPGICRLSWALFNWDTWFSSDCSVLSASPEQYLRVALSANLYYSDGLESGAGFELLSALNEVAIDRLDYEVVGGKLYAPALRDSSGFGQGGIDLVRPVTAGYPGYQIEIDIKDKFHFTVRTLAPTIQDLANRAKVIDFVDQDGSRRTFIRFG